MAHCTYRPATREDEPGLLRLMEAYYRHDGLAFDPERARGAVRMLTGEPALGELWLIERDGEAVGYFALTFGFSLECGGRDAFVDELFLIEACRGQGFGTDAIRHAIARARELGIRALRLEAMHRNARAVGLYRRLGFADHERHLLTLTL